MFIAKYSSRFKKDLKLYKNNNSLLVDLEKVLDYLIEEKVLPKKYNIHPLVGEFKGCFECHVRPNILLIYKIEKKELLILMLRIGSHAKLFG